MPADPKPHGRIDPAIENPTRPGLRPHLHPPNRLHPWVFRQHQVWVDYWGNEHEIESMPRDYIENVIRFCDRQAARLRCLVRLDIFLEAGALTPNGHFEKAEAAVEGAPAPDTDPMDWLAGTQLMLALRRRFERPDPDGAERQRRGAA